MLRVRLPRAPLIMFTVCTVPGTSLLEITFTLGNRQHEDALSAMEAPLRRSRYSSHQRTADATAAQRLRSDGVPVRVRLNRSAAERIVRSLSYQLALKGAHPTHAHGELHATLIHALGLRPSVA